MDFNYNDQFLVLGESTALRIGFIFSYAKFLWDAPGGESVLKLYKSFNLNRLATHMEHLVSAA